MRIDLNADLGEGASADAELMALVTSANVCCGAHAGDPVLIRSTLQLANQRGVTVGAHPGYPDREHFGRREMTLTPEIGAHCLYQIGGLIAISRVVPIVVKYLKPHGALYNQACRDPELAKTIVAVALMTGLELVGLPDSELEVAAKKLNVPFHREGFADRRYRADGSLTPRTEPDAFIHDPAEAIEQVDWLIREKHVRTICVHGDNPEAVRFTSAVRESLLKRSVQLQPFA